MRLSLAVIYIISLSCNACFPDTPCACLCLSPHRSECTHIEQINTLYWGQLFIFKTTKYNAPNPRCPNIRPEMCFLTVPNTTTIETWQQHRAIKKEIEKTVGTGASVMLGSRCVPVNLCCLLFIFYGWSFSAPMQAGPICGLSLFDWDKNKFFFQECLCSVFFRASAHAQSHPIAAW